MQLKYILKYELRSYCNKSNYFIHIWGQGSQDEPENKGILYNFGYKGVYLGANVEVFLL